MSDGWFQFAACRGVGPDLFYPYRNGTLEYSGPERARIDQAKAVCARCSVVGECLAYAIRFGECHGVWGGLLPEERPHGLPSKWCPVCGVQFTPATFNGVLCSDECRRLRALQQRREYRERESA